MRKTVLGMANLLERSRERRNEPPSNPPLSQVVQFDTVTTRFSLPQADGGGFSLEGMETYPRLYLCGQSVMKMHPSFDEVLVEVLLGDPGGVVVLLSSVKQAVWQRIVRDRLLRKVRDAGIEESRVVFVPQLDRGEKRGGAKEPSLRSLTYAPARR